MLWEQRLNPLIVRGKCRRFGCAFIDQISLERTPKHGRPNRFYNVPPPPPPPSRLAPLVFLSPSIFQTVHKTVIRNVSTSVYAPRVSLVKLIKDRSRKLCYAVVTYCCRDLRLRNCTTISRLILYNSQLKLIINVELILMWKYLKIDFKIEY